MKIDAEYPALLLGSMTGLPTTFLQSHFLASGSEPDLFSGEQSAVLSAAAVQIGPSEEVKKSKDVETGKRHQGQGVPLYVSGSLHLW